MSTAAGIVCAVAVAVFCVTARTLAAARGDREAAGKWAGIAGTAYAAEGLFDAMQGSWWAVAVNALLAALWFWLSRRNRRKRKRARKLIGAKARAVLAAMAKNMPKPGPAPQGARA